MEEGEIIGWTWWSTMLLISIFNFVLLFYIIRKYPTPPSDIQPRREQNIMRISAIIFTVVCAYRAILPRIDVPRTCWFNTFANWIIFGRTGACIAEIWFVLTTNNIYNFELNNNNLYIVGQCKWDYF